MSERDNKDRAAPWHHPHPPARTWKRAFARTLRFRVSSILILPSTGCWYGGLLYALAICQAIQQALAFGGGTKECDSAQATRLTNVCFSGQGSYERGVEEHGQTALCERSIPVGCPNTQHQRCLLRRVDGHRAVPEVAEAILAALRSAVEEA